MAATIWFEKNYLRDIAYLTHGDNLAALETYANHLKAYSHAAISRLTITTKKAVLLPATTGDYESLTVQAKLLVRDLDSNDLFGIMIPAPLAFLFEEITGQGYRVKQALGEEITGYYAQYAGLNLRFEDGWLVGSK
jgi:hypothetical protein